tara:strand:+ start:289 stop:552 length:264 start_codon:yes stop_codon:yes gene_type:complete
MINGNELEDVVINLSGDLLMLDWNGQERLISLKDLVDTFKNDMKNLRDRTDTDEDAVEYMDKAFSEKLMELAEYSQGISIKEKRTLQ